MDILSCFLEAFQLIGFLNLLKAIMIQLSICLIIYSYVVKTYKWEVINDKSQEFYTLKIFLVLVVESWVIRTFVLLKTKEISFISYFFILMKNFPILLNAPVAYVFNVLFFNQYIKIPSLGFALYLTMLSMSFYLTLDEETFNPFNPLIKSIMMGLQYKIKLFFMIFIILLPIILQDIFFQSLIEKMIGQVWSLSTTYLYNYLFEEESLFYFNMTVKIAQTFKVEITIILFFICVWIPYSFVCLAVFYENAKKQNAFEIQKKKQ